MGLGDLLTAAARALWGPGTLALVVGTGVYLTVRMGFLPLRNMGWAMGAALGRKARSADGGGLSPFSALMTALASTVGTGNIVGVAAALAAGGPGALVWMELAALFSLATKLGECLLSALHRRPDGRGGFHGGPMYVMADVFGGPGRVMGALFALFALGASFGIGSMTQANAMAAALETCFSVPAWKTGAVAAAAALAVMLGGAGGIARVATLVVPVMAVGYFAACLGVIWVHRAALPAALAEMFAQAFSLRAAAGGAAGAAFGECVRQGVSRGVFSHEAGMGSAAIAAASSGGDPVRQGYIAMTGVVFDTLILCTVTGLALCCAGVVDSGAEGAAMALLAFEQALGPAGAGAIAVSVALFAFTSILGWAYQGEEALAYLAGRRAVTGYRVLFALAALLGAVSRLDTVFAFSDLCNGLMCLPNLLCLLALSGRVCREVRAFEARRR